MAIKINANMSEEHKRMLVDWIPRLIGCFEKFQCKLIVHEAYVGMTFVQFFVEDQNKTRFSEFMMEKLTDTINEEFKVKDTDITTDSVVIEYALLIQIPLEKREFVSFSSMTSTKDFIDGSRYLFTVGQNVRGKMLYCDLQQEKRLLIGGAANAGKSIFLHSMICSLLHKNGADSLRLILFDQNEVFQDYLSLPHIMFHGLISDDYGVKEANEWIKGEIEWRKTLFARHGCRNLEEYNRYADVSNEDHFPAVLVVVDELADWAKNHENMKMFFSTLKIKQAAEHGVFFAIATQKPSIDYLGASIKEEFDVRMVFKLENAINSRIMLNKSSAVKLQGEGDMYYLNLATKRLERLQAPIVTREDIKDATSKYESSY